MNFIFCVSCGNSYNAPVFEDCPFCVHNKAKDDHPTYVPVNDTTPQEHDAETPDPFCTIKTEEPTPCSMCGQGGVRSEGMLACARCLKYNFDLAEDGQYKYRVPVKLPIMLFKRTHRPEKTGNIYQDDPFLGKAEWPHALRCRSRTGEVRHLVILSTFKTTHLVWVVELQKMDSVEIRIDSKDGDDKADFADL